MNVEDLSNADLCRYYGWGPGTCLVGDEGYGPSVIRITAVGEKAILARRIKQNGEETRDCEGFWTLDCRDWQPVTPSDD